METVRLKLSALILRLRTKVVELDASFRQLWANSKHTSKPNRPDTKPGN